MKNNEMPSFGLKVDPNAPKTTTGPRLDQNAPAMEKQEVAASTPEATKETAAESKKTFDVDATEGQIVKKTSVFKKLFQTMATGLSRSLNRKVEAVKAVGSKIGEVNEKVASSLYTAADPKAKGIENMSVPEVTGNLGKAAGNAVVEGTSSVARGVEKSFNPEGKDLMEMGLGEMGQNFFNTIDDKVSDLGESLENGFKKLMKWAEKKIEEQNKIMNARLIMEQQAAEAAREKRKENLDKVKKAIGAQWNSLVEYGKNSIAKASTERKYHKSLYNQTLNNWKLDGMKIELAKMEKAIREQGDKTAAGEADIEHYKEKLASMENKTKQMNTVEMTFTPTQEASQEAAA